MGLPGSGKTTLSKKLVKFTKSVWLNADFICPTKKTRADFNPDYIVWMNTISEGRFDDTNKMFENPNSEEVDYIVTKKDAEIYSKDIYEKIKKKFNLN